MDLDLGKTPSTRSILTAAPRLLELPAENPELSKCSKRPAWRSAPFRLTALPTFGSSAGRIWISSRTRSTHCKHVYWFSTCQIVGSLLSTVVEWSCRQTSLPVEPPQSLPGCFAILHRDPRRVPCPRDQNDTPHTATHPEIRAPQPPKRPTEKPPSRKTHPGISGNFLANEFFYLTTVLLLRSIRRGHPSKTAARAPIRAPESDGPRPQ